MIGHDYLARGMSDSHPRIRELAYMCGATSECAKIRSRDDVCWACRRAQLEEELWEMQERMDAYNREMERLADRIVKREDQLRDGKARYRDVAERVAERYMEQQRKKRMGKRFGRRSY